MPSVNDQRHAALEQAVNEFLAANNFITDRATYHEVMAQVTQARLAFLDTATSLGIRTRADRIAIHNELPCCFEWEAKTRLPWTAHKNLVIEAFPLALHILKAKLGIRVLYVYRDAENDIDCGFWCDKHPPIDCIFVPPRGRHIEEALRYAFPETELVRLNGTRGSDDPFAKISFDFLQMLADWRMEIVAELETCKQATQQVATGDFFGGIAA